MAHLRNLQLPGCTFWQRISSCFSPDRLCWLYWSQCASCHHCPGEWLRGEHTPGSGLRVTLKPSWHQGDTQDGVWGCPEAQPCLQLLQSQETWVDLMGCSPVRGLLTLFLICSPQFLFFCWQNSHLLLSWVTTFGYFIRHMG